MRSLLPFIALFAGLIAAPPLAAQTVQNTAELDRLVAGLTGAPIGQPGGARGPVDPRLHLSACAVEPTANWFGAGQTSVKLECPVPGGWTVYVPLVKAEASRTVIARGDPVAIELRGNGFALTSHGEALSAGALGASITVRLPGQDARAQAVAAKVIGPGKVGIDLP